MIAPGSDQYPGMATSRAPSNLLIRLDPRLREGLQQQIYGSVRRAILEGVLAPGTRVPSSRALATDLGVSRTTTLLAVQQLQAEGYLTARRGSGTSVAVELPDDLVERSGARPASRPRHPTLSRRGAAVAAVQEGARRLDGPPRAFRLGTPGVDLFPVGLWSRLASRRLRSVTSARPSSRSYRPATRCPSRPARTSRRPHPCHRPRPAEAGGEVPLGTRRERLRRAPDPDLVVDRPRLVRHVGPGAAVRLARDAAASAIVAWTASSAQIVVRATASRSGSPGSTRSPAAPISPGSGPTADATTGVPQARASMAGRPAASETTGRSTARAPRTRAARSGAASAGAYAMASPTPRRAAARRWPPDPRGSRRP